MGALIAVSTAAVLVVSSVGASWSSTTGDFPEWLEACATFAAFVGAAIAARFAASAYRIEEAREADRADARLMAQASQIAIWIEHDDPVYWEPTPISPPGTMASLTLPGVRVRGHNGSNLPVYRVTAAIRHSVFMHGVWQRRWYEHILELLPPGDFSESRGNEKFESALPSGVAAVPFIDRAADTDIESIVHFTFTDSAGVTWSRSASGVLTPKNRGIAS